MATAPIPIADAFKKSLRVNRVMPASPIDVCCFILASLTVRARTGP